MRYSPANVIKDKSLNPRKVFVRKLGEEKIHFVGFTRIDKMKKFEDSIFIPTWDEYESCDNDDANPNHRYYLNDNKFEYMLMKI